MVLIWNDKFNSIVDDGVISDTVVGLVLIHPDYRIQHNGMDIMLKDDRFVRQIERSAKCEWKKYGGYECPWNNDVFLRGALEIDHHWPSSLGGQLVIQTGCTFADITIHAKVTRLNIMIGKTLHHGFYHC